MIKTEQIEAMRMLIRYLQYRSSPPGPLGMDAIAERLGVGQKRQLNKFFKNDADHGQAVAFFNAAKPKLREVLLEQAEIPPSVRVVCESVFPGEGFYEPGATVEENVQRYSVSISLSAWGILASVKEEIEDLNSKKPNDNEGLEDWEKKKAFLTGIERNISGLVDALDHLEPTSKEVSEATRIINELSKEFQSWLEENRPELVDWTLRLPIAAASLGLLGLVGANMTWATPFVLASVGGSKAIKVISALRKAEKGQGDES